MVTTTSPKMDHYEESLSNEHNYLKNIRGEFGVCIGRFDSLRESYNRQRFLNALNILENDYRLIQLSGPDFATNESLTEWRITDPLRLEEFIKKKSINYILRRII